MHDKEVVPETKPDEVRVAVIGDSYAAPSGIAHADAWHTLLEQKAQEELEKMVAPYEGSGLKIERVIVFGNRTEEILKFGEGQAVDLMVMNSHKVNLSDPVQGWGTIGYKIGILAQCPVMLVK